LHRDISINNVMLSPPKNEGECKRGLLIDLDYAFIFKKPFASNPDTENPETAETVETSETTEDVSSSHSVLLHRTVCLISNA
jgi:hypothetical protein